MKKIIVAMIALFALSSATFAQTEDSRSASRPSKEEMIKERTERTVKRYGLNDTQAKQLLELNTKYAGKMAGPFGGRRMGQRPGGRQRPEGAPNDSAIQRRRPSREEMKARFAEMKANREAYEKELKGIFTTEQYTKYQEDAAKMKERFAKKSESKE